MAKPLPASPALAASTEAFREIRELSNSSQDTANRIQELNGVITDAVNNLSENAQQLVDYMSGSVLKELYWLSSGPEASIRRMPPISAGPWMNFMNGPSG